jgi:dienelactone hydrolase
VDERTHPVLGEYGDWIAQAKQRKNLYPSVDVPGLTSDEVLGLIGSPGPGEPLAPARGRRWTSAGVSGEEVSWSVGYGPRTHAWMLRPADVSGPLPGVVALHSHDGFTYFGKEKVADGPDPAPEAVRPLRDRIYEGTAFANELARRGFAVLVHDVFRWGSRRFPPESMDPAPSPSDDPVAYNDAARLHEHTVAKYCTVLGTSMAGVVAYEDRVAVRYLRSRDDVDAGPIGCIGLSGGGCRAALLHATCPDIAAACVVGMMTTHPELLDGLIARHTWMFFPPGLAARGDWPDIAAARAPTPLLVQYNRHDHLFTLPGMTAAHERLAARYRQAGSAESYVGEFYDGDHKFDRAMQVSAYTHLARWLVPGGR